MEVINHHLSQEAINNRLMIADIKRRYSTGQISRDEAKLLAKPILDRINKRGLEISIKYGKKSYSKIDFVSIMR